MAVWIWADSEGISSAREIERLCEYRPELQWLCGMERSPPTLSDFRVSQSEALEGMFTNVLAVLSEANLIDLEQLAVDGRRLRSQGSTSSQRRRGTIEKHLEQANAVVEELGAQAEDEASNKRRQAARKRADRERVERLNEALDDVRRIAKGRGGKKKKSEAQASETEPEARLQHESNGGWGVGYNAQFATDAKEKIVVGVELTNNASDAQQLKPTLEDMERRLQQKAKQVLADNGYNSRANIARTQAEEIEYVTPGSGAGQALDGSGAGGGDPAGVRDTVFHLRRKDGHVSMSGKQRVAIPGNNDEEEEEIPLV